MGYGSLTPLAASVLLPFAGAIALWIAYSDMKYMKIPNKASLAMMAIWAGIGLACVAFAGLPFAAWAWGWALGAIVLVIGFLLNMIRLIGGGDAKFAAAMAPFFTGAPGMKVAILAASCLITAFIAHRLIRALPAVRHAAPDWVSWTSRDFPMGLALAGTLIFHLLLTILAAY